MKNGVIDGTRTRDNRNHNPGLYQLSYDHRFRRARDLSHADGFAKGKNVSKKEFPPAQCRRGFQCLAPGLSEACFTHFSRCCRSPVPCPF